MTQLKVKVLALAAAMLMAGPALAVDVKADRSGATLFSAVGGGSVSSGIVPAAAGDLVVNVAGIQSVDAQGEVGNFKLVLDATPGALVDLVAWDVNLTAFGASYLSEIAVTFTNSAGDGVILRPGVSAGNPGTASFSGSGSLLAAALSFNIGADGKLFLEFHETFDDDVGADGVWNSGTLTFAGIGAVPEAGSLLMMSLGLLAVGAVARRRQA